MDAGRLDRLITLRRIAAGVNGYGEPTRDLQDLAEVRAKVEPVSDGERMRAGESLSEQKFRFVVRYSSQVSGVDTRDFVQFDGRLYDINGIKPLGRRKHLEITATARAEQP